MAERIPAVKVWSIRAFQYTVKFPTLVAFAVRRYKDRVHYWEIWNEPDEQGMPPQLYAELVKRGSAAIRSVDPSAKVIAGRYHEWTSPT